MGSGKTTIGKELCLPVGFDFIDTDEYIEQQQGLTVPQIFSEKGETVFRQLERAALQELIRLDFVVISTGGGMPCYMNNMDIMLNHGKVVYLKTSPQALARRLFFSKTDRPLVKGKTREELELYIKEKLKEREPVYQQAHFTIETENFSRNELLQSLCLMK